jgi:hypothetical protein
VKEGESVLVKVIETRSPVCVCVCLCVFVYVRIRRKERQSGEGATWKEGEGGREGGMEG